MAQDKINRYLENRKKRLEDEGKQTNVSVPSSAPGSYGSADKVNDYLKRREERIAGSGYEQKLRQRDVIVGQRAQENRMRDLAEAATRQENAATARELEQGMGWGARLMMDRQRETAQAKMAKSASEAAEALRQRAEEKTAALPSFKRQDLAGNDRFSQAEATGEYNPYEDALAAIRKRMAEQQAAAREMEETAVRKPDDLPKLSGNHLLGGSFDRKDFVLPQPGMKNGLIGPHDEPVRIDAPEENLSTLDALLANAPAIGAQMPMNLNAIAQTAEIEKIKRDEERRAAFEAENAIPEGLKPGAFDVSEWLSANAMAGWTQFGGRIIQSVNSMLEPAQEAGAWLGKRMMEKVFGDEYAGMIAPQIDKMTEEPVLGDVYHWAVDPMNQAAEYAGEINDNGGYLAKIGGSVIQNAVAQIPNAIIALMTGGANTALDAFNRAQTTFGGAVMNEAKKMVSNPNFLMSFAQMYGGRYEDAQAGGADPYTAALTAALTTLMNAAVEQGGGIEGLPFTRATVGDWVENALEEGGEEVVQQVIDQIGQKMLVDDSIPWLSTEDERAVINPKVLGENALLGTVAGGLIGGPGMIINNALNGDVQEENFDGAPELSGISMELAQEESRSGMDKKDARFAAMTEEEISDAQRKAAGVDRYGDAAGSTPTGRDLLRRLAEEAADAEIAEESTTLTDTAGAAEPMAEEAMIPADRNVRRAAEKYGDAATVFEANYEGGDIEAYDKGFNALYTAGRVNLKLEDIESKIRYLTRGINDVQKRAIWQAGRNAELKTIAPGAKLMITTKATDSQKRQFKMLDEIGRRYGYEIDIVDSIADGIANGAYSGGKRIVVAKDAAYGAIVQAGVHEMVHALRRNDAAGYDVLKAEVMHWLENSDSFVGLEYAVGERIKQYRENRQEISREDAIEEIVAEAVPTFLTDEQAVRAFVQRDRTLAQKVRDFFVNFAKEIRRIAERYMLQVDTESGAPYDSARYEISALLGKSDALTAIAETFDRAMEAADDKEAAPGGETVFAGRKKEIKGADDVSVSKEESSRLATDLPVSGETEAKWSLARNSEFMDNARAANEKTGKVDSETLDEAERMRAAVKAYMEEHSEVMHLPADIEGDTFFADGAYGGSEENTSVCVRSMAVQELMDIVAKDLGRPLTVEDTLLISQEVAGYTDKPECYYCYVAQDRRAIREFLGGYIDQREEVLKRIRAGEDKESVRQSWLNGRKNTPNMKARFDFWTSADAKGIELIKASDLAHMENLNAEITNLQTRIADAIGGKVTFVGIGYKQDGGRARSFDGVLKTADDALRASINRYIQLADALSYAKSASWAKKQTGYAAYNGHILKWKDEKIAGLNSHYGLRMYSFSDFSPAFILENMQMLTDAAVRGLKVLAYTKEMDFAHIFAPTGANINISTFAQEINGQITADGMMGADWAEAIRLREKYPNVGITFVATNDRLAAWAEQQEWIDTVIPYHLVRTGTKVAQYFGYKNYTAESSDRKKAGVKFRKGDVTSIPPEMHNNDIVKYVQALERHNLTPRFENRINGYKDFVEGRIGEDEFRTMNPYYMKYVNETRRSASQTPSVQPVFELDDAIESMKNMIKEGGYGAPIGQSYEVMQEIGEEIADKIRGQENQTRFSLNNTAAIESILTEDQNLMLPADVDVREESIRGVAASALSRGISERMNQQITGVANKILRETGSTYAKADIIANMKRLIDEYAANGATEETLRAVAEMAKKIIESSSRADNTLRERYADLRKKLRETGISLTETQKQEAANEAGSYNAYRQSLMGTVKLANDGISLDEIWGELSSQNPEIFPPDTGEAEMVGRLTDFMMLMKPKYENPYGMDTDGAALEMAMRIQGDLMGILGARDAAKAMYGTAEKFRKQYEDEFKVRLARQKKERVEKFQQIASDLRAAKAAGDAKEQAKIMNRYRAAMKATALDEAYAEIRATYKEREAQKAENRKANEMRGRVAKQAGELMKMFTRPEKGKRIPTKLQGLVLEVLEALDLNGAKADAEGRETAKAQAFRERLSGIRTFYEQVMNSQSRGEAPEGLDGLMMTISERNLADMQEALDVLGSGDRFLLRDMNSDQLRSLEKLLKNIRHTVETVGKLWRIQRYQNVAELGDASIDQMDSRKEQKLLETTAAGKVRDFLALDMLEPVSYGERLGEGGEAIIQNLMDGEKIKFGKIRDAAAATQKMLKDTKVTGYDIGKWRKNVRSVKLGSGRVVKMSDVNLMELYLTANRPQGLQHLLGNGMRIRTSDETGAQTMHVQLTQADIAEMGGMLTDKQRALADRMQAYLSGDVAKWGNDVTQRMYLYDAFTEDRYWPISSDPNLLKSQEPECDRAFNAIVNAGFTKPLNQMANNPVIIGDAFETFNRHIGEMASYAGYAEVMTDTMAWINYRQRTEKGLIAGSVKQSIERLLGTGGLRYLTKLVQDINGARRGGDGMQIANALLRNYKANAVMGKIRVAIQQPTSIVRAAAEINPAYLLNGLKAGKDAVQEMQKWSNLAWWKSNGNYDIGIGKSTDEIFWGETSLLDHAKDTAAKIGALGIDPGKMDDWAWARMWSAVKREIRSKRSDLAYGSDEYFRAVAERFEYIMDRTQVVDTVMHRSDLMRSKDGLIKNLTAFKSEPTKSYNMLMRAIMEAGRNPKSKAAKLKLARTTGAFAASAAATAAATALFDAFKNRDDEDDLWTYLTEGGFWTDWVKAFFDGFAGNINIAGSIPLVGEAMETIQGRDVTVMQFEGIGNIANAATIFMDHFFGENTEKTTKWGAMKPAIATISQLAGLPVSGMIANGEMLVRIYDPKLLQTKSEIAALDDAYLVMYQAIADGNANKAADIRARLIKGLHGATPKNPKEIDTGIAHALAKNDERVMRAYELREKGNSAKQVLALKKQIVADGFTDAQVTAAINYCETLVNTEESEKDMTAQLTAKMFATDDLYAAIRNGSVEDVAAVAEYLENVSEAKDPAKSIRSAVSGEFKQEYLELIDNGKTAQAERLAMKMAVVGIDGNDIAGWIKDGRYEGMKEAVEAGNTDEARAYVDRLIENGADVSDVVSSLNSRFRSLYIEYMRSGKRTQANRLREVLQGLGLYWKDGRTNYFRDEKLKEWLEEAE